MTKKVLVPVAEGVEEVETVTIIDVLRRAGADVTIASTTGHLQVKCAHKLNIVADKLISDCKDTHFDLIAVPGGMPGAEHLRDCKVLTAMLKAQKDANRWYAAICASPAVVFETHGLLEGCTATSSVFLFILFFYIIFLYFYFIYY
eukprot:GHVR01032186.1.p1 GENE.GHVR01032186.1~~GHVR01032186.1.p1  ORF type:complete len:146 (+),score=32.50 GHVR01032186.1:63-500(+)